MSARPVFPTPPRVTGATDGTLYQVAGEALVPITRADGSAPQDGDVVKWDATLDKAVWAAPV